MRRLIYIAILILLATSCGKSKNGQIKAELSDFDSIRFESPFIVELMRSDQNSISIEGFEKIIEKVDYHVENGTLILKNNFKNSWAYPKKNKIKLTINYKTINQIEAKETCEISTINAIVSSKLTLIFKSKLNNANLELDCELFHYWNNWPCGGTLKLRGKSDKFAIWNCALVEVDARELLVNEAYIENQSKGKCSATVLQKLEYAIYGSGNIELYSTPSELIEKEITSSGKLVIH